MLSKQILATRHLNANPAKVLFKNSRIRNFCLLIVSFLIVSCGDREISEELKNQLDEENLIHECLAYITSKDQDIESQGQRFESLVYTNEVEECKSVLWYLKDSLAVVREITRNLKTNEQHEISYYFSQGELYLVQDIADTPRNEGETSSHELIVVFKNNKPYRAWENEMVDGYFDPNKYANSDKKNYSPDRAIDMFNHNKSFVLHFEDFLNSDGENYLLVNTGQKDNFIAAIKIEAMDAFLNELSKNKEKFKNAALQINHQAVNQSGWVFHYYINGDFLK
jgi:hypothetical protein